MYIVLPCNKASVLKFKIEFQDFSDFQISFNATSPLVSVSTRGTCLIVPPSNRAGISNFYLEFCWKLTLAFVRSYRFNLICFTRDISHIVSPLQYNLPKSFIIELTVKFLGEVLSGRHVSLFIFYNECCIKEIVLSLYLVQLVMLWPKQIEKQCKS